MKKDKKITVFFRQTPLTIYSEVGRRLHLRENQSIKAWVDYIRVINIDAQYGISLMKEQIGAYRKPDYEKKPAK